MPAAAETNGTSPGVQHASIAAEATRILTDLLARDDSLKMPPAVTGAVSKVVFTPDVEAFLPTPLKMSETASALWACIGLFADAVCQERYRTGAAEKITVDVYSATLMLGSVFMFHVDGKHFLQGPVASRFMHLDKGGMRETYKAAASNIYKTADNRYYHLHGSLDASHTLRMLNLPQHRPDLQGKLAESKDVYRALIAKRESLALEIEANERWLQPGVTCLTADEFANTPHGKVNVQEPLYHLSAVNEHLPPTPWPRSLKNAGRPLAGLRVLDFTRVIAGPTVTRILAQLGADVLRVSSDTQAEPMVFVADSQIGKRDTDINLKTPEGKLKVDELLKDADVVVNSYRPGALEKLGFSRAWVHEIARRRGKGIVYCRENCYGWRGEWSGRAGYQPISDAVTGASWAQGNFLGLDEPVMPLWPNSDSQTGVIGAIAILHALLRRSSEGGSYSVDVSLNQFNNWNLRTVGLYDAQTQASLRALHPDFRPGHETGFHEMVPMVLKTTKRSNGTGSGQLWDPARFTTTGLRWGNADEEGTYLDWTRIVDVQGAEGKRDVVFRYDRGSCMPGGDVAEWLVEGDE